MSQAVSKQAESDSRRASTRSRARKLLLLLFSIFFCLIIFVGLDGIYSAVFRKSAVPTPSELFGCLTPDPDSRALAQTKLFRHACLGQRSLPTERQQPGLSR